MNPIVKVVLAASLFCLVLYYAVSGFIGTTDELNGSLDVRSLAHIRDDGTAVEAAAASAVQVDETLAGEAATDTAVTSGPGGASPGAVATSNSARGSDEGRVKTQPTISAAAQAQASAQRLKSALGIVEPPPPVRAVDVMFEIPPNCDVSDIVLASLPVKYRHESPSIKGVSINELQVMVAKYHRCEGGVFRFLHNPLGKEDATPMLMQARLDELKYFFLQHRVPKAALRFPDNS